MTANERQMVFYTAIGCWLPTLAISHYYVGLSCDSRQEYSSSPSWPNILAIRFLPPSVVGRVAYDECKFPVPLIIRLSDCYGD